jgi:hypothetical protein
MVASYNVRTFSRERRGKRMLVYPTRRVLLLMACLAPGMTGQTSQVRVPTFEDTGKAPTGLEVLAATLDPQSPHKQVAVQLHNLTHKTIVAYSLETEGFDAQGNKIGEFRPQFDYAGPGPNPAKVNFIPSGSSATVDYTKPEPPDPRLVKLFPESPPPDFSALDAMASVHVSVLGVVYEDRTFEGAADGIFDYRRRKAAQARQALKLFLNGYPSTLEENSKAMLQLRFLGFNPPEEARTKQHWVTIGAEVQRDADWWELQSQPQGATR